MIIETPKKLGVIDTPEEIAPAEKGGKTTLDLGTDENGLRIGVPTKRITGTSNLALPPNLQPGADDPIEYDIDGFLESNTLSMIVGQSKSGKSTLAMQMAFCIQNGIPLFGYNCNKAGVLVVDTEQDAKHLNARIKDLMEFYNFRDAELPLYSLYRKQIESNKTNIEEIVNDIRNILMKNPSIKVVIIDCMYNLFRGARNEEGNMLKYLLPLKSIITDMSVSVIYVMHTNKAFSKTNPTASQVLAAAGGSGIHGKIVDTSFLVIPLNPEGTVVKLATVGRTFSFDTIICAKNKETLNFLHNASEKAQEIVEVNNDLCKEIAEYIEQSGCIDERHIKNKFHVSSSELRELGFGVDTKNHQIFMNKSRLKLDDTNTN